MNPRIFYILTALVAMAALSACGMLPGTATDSAKQETAQPPIETSKLRDDATRRVQEEASRLIQAQDYAGATTLIHKQIGKGLSEKALASQYLQAANGSIGQAEDLVKQGHYAEAGRLYQTILARAPVSAELQEQIAASPGQLAEAIAHCAEKLVEAGLAAYRAGDFTAAIDIWQQVLGFNPQHPEALSSIQTTRQQLSNLKKLERQD